MQTLINVVLLRKCIKTFRLKSHNNITFLYNKNDSSQQYDENVMLRNAVANIGQSETQTVTVRLSISQYDR